LDARRQDVVNGKSGPLVVTKCDGRRQCRYQQLDLTLYHKCGMMIAVGFSRELSPSANPFTEEL
jgi:hypothetical protein